MQELLAVLPNWLGVYLLTVNVAAFAVYGADKLRARQGRWRVPEKTEQNPNTLFPSAPFAQEPRLHILFLP